MMEVFSMPDASMHDLAVTLARIEERVRHMTEKVDKFDERLTLLEGIGKKRWETVISQIITLVVAAIIGGLISKM
jgi:hypothetical protein